MSSRSDAISRDAGRKLAVYGFVLTAFFVAAAAPTPLYRFYQSAYHIAPVVITLVFAVYAFALLVALLVAGSISDHLGRRPVIIGALILEMIAMALFVLADGAAILIAARIVQGVATGTVAVLFRRSRPALANLRWGIGFVVMGVLTVAAGVNVGSVPILALGTIVSGIGFGTSFLGSTGYLMPLAGPEERAELLSVFYIESYLAFGLPLIAAGYVVTVNLFATVLLVLTAIGLPFPLRKAG